MTNAWTTQQKNSTRCSIKNADIVTVKDTAMKKNILLGVTFFCALSALLVSCKSTPKTTDPFAKPNEYTVDEWKNPNLIGGKTTNVVVEGYADISAKGKMDARDRATQSALQNAVKAGVGEHIDSETIVKNYALVSHEIYAKTTGYVESYKVLSTRETSDMYYVTIEAVVGLDRIHDSLKAMGLVIDRVNFPLIAVLVEETADNGKGKTWTTSSFGVALEEYMASKGFKFVDQKTLEQVLAKNHYRLQTLNSSSSAEAIQTIGLSTGAEVIIVGTVTAKYAMNISGTQMKSYRASASVKAVNSANARAIAQATGQVGGVGLTDIDAADKAMMDVAAKWTSAAKTNAVSGIALDLTRQISGEWQKVAQQGTEYTLLLTGLAFGDQLKFEDGMKKYLADVKEVFSKGSLGDSAEYLVRYNGLARDFAAALYRNADKMGFTIDIKNFDDKTITATAKAKAK